MIITNITNIGDPQILLHGDTYYCYATSFIRGFYVWTSKDLITWSEPKVCMAAGADHWGEKDFSPPYIEFHIIFVILFLLWLE